MKWKDVDLERHIITINDAEKNSNPRQLEISDKLVTMLKEYLRQANLSLEKTQAKE